MDINHEHDSITMTVEQLAIIIYTAFHRKMPYWPTPHWDLEPDEEKEVYLQYAVEYYQEIVEDESE